MNKTSAEARYRAKHEDLPFHDGRFGSWSAKRGSRTPFHAFDGVAIWVADVDYSPDDSFL